MRKSRYLKIATAAAVAQGTVCRTVIWIDAAPIRKEATRKYNDAKKQFGQTQATLARFHERDKPEFERWLQKKFPKLVGELREAQAELNRLRELIFEVETRTWFHNQSCAAAYRDVLDRQARRRAGHVDPVDPDDLEEKMHAHMEAEARDEAEEAADLEAGRGKVKRPHLGAEKEARLKAAYRAMARRLHPDRHADVTPLMRERWHEAQQAYLAGDVELLESLESLCADEETDVTAETPVSLIFERTKRLAASITQLTMKTQQCRKSNAWAFSVLEDFSRIEEIMAKKLPGQIDAAKNEISELEEKVAQWRADAERFYPGFKEAHPEEKKKRAGGAAKRPAPTPPPVKKAVPKKTMPKAAPKMAAKPAAKATPVKASAKAKPKKK